MRRIRNFKLFVIQNLKTLFFCFGLSLTLWRSSECFKKYLDKNLSTKVSLVENFEALLPSLVICASGPYNKRQAYNTLTKLTSYTLYIVQMAITNNFSKIHQKVNQFEKLEAAKAAYLWLPLVSFSYLS